MRKAWVISDTHLNHDKIKTYCQRPDNFTELIHNNIMRMLGPEDYLIHLGDVGIGKSENFMKLVQEWKCRKALVRGNHDGKSCFYYMDNGFDFACDAMIFRGAYLTHKPSDFLPEGCHVNLHGHLHNVWDGFVNEDPEKQDPAFYNPYREKRLKHSWQRLFSVEYTNYLPVEFDRFIAKPDKYQARGPSAQPSKEILSNANPFYHNIETEELI